MLRLVQRVYDLEWWLIPHALAVHLYSPDDTLPLSGVDGMCLWPCFEAHVDDSADMRHALLIYAMERETAQTRSAE